METTAVEETARTIVVPLDEVEWRDSGDPDKAHETTLRGHAAVFNSLSEDLGGFRELIEPGFFRAALRRKPDVRLLFNHDPNYVLARTASETLELREDIRGLHVFAVVDKEIPWVDGLRRSMQRGDIDQMSFAFTLREGDDAADSWAVADDGTVIRTLRADGADQLFDTSVVTYPAYRATDVTMRSLLEQAIASGRLPEPAARADQIAESDNGETDIAVRLHIEGEMIAETVVQGSVVNVAQAEEPAGVAVADTFAARREAVRNDLQAEREATLKLYRRITG